MQNKRKRKILVKMMQDVPKKKVQEPECMAKK